MGFHSLRERATWEERRKLKGKGVERKMEESALKETLSHFTTLHRMAASTKYLSIDYSRFLGINKNCKI